MSGLFDRWLGDQATAQVAPTPQAVGLQLWLDDLGHVLRLAGPLRTVLPASSHSAPVCMTTCNGTACWYLKAPCRLAGATAGP
ncbi:hypothetical protein QFA96_04935 [Pseudomonas sp. Ap32]|nr:hypothetical protein QFA96_04935 [Pseudomonas sp. Ap32]